MTQSINLGVIMDPIQSINTIKDSTFAMMLEAQVRNWTIHYMLPTDLYLRDGLTYAKMQTLQLKDSTSHWFVLGPEKDQPLHLLDAVLMRKDPPFNMEYIYTTYLLEMAQAKGLLVVNRPESIRSYNEKLFATHFPEFTPPTLVSSDNLRIKAFIEEQESIVVKPLDGMGGSQIFQIHVGDPNTNTILETITNDGQTTIMAQRFLPEYVEGDKRILIIDGEPFPYGLSRIPQKGESRANLAAGATYKGSALTQREWEICETIKPTLQSMGLLFVGLDVIGDYITEINITSPTCIRELDHIYNTNIASLLMDAIYKKYHNY